MEKRPCGLRTIFTFYDKKIRGIILFYIAVDDGISKHAFAKDSEHNDKVVCIVFRTYVLRIQ